ncbi:MAG: phosphoribosylformylglycinamidine cyclo-ligase [Candidatus Bathyarchaeia archaeon]
MGRDDLRDRYAEAGVDSKREEEVMDGLRPVFEATFSFRRGIGAPAIPIGHFAGIVRLDAKRGLALKTDGVGTKILIAQLMEKYDTIGIDCVAMCVNDVICVGAEPISFLDYIAVERIDPELLRELARGLAKGAEMAGVSIVGGEIAQIPDMIKGKVEGRGFDLVGMCAGVVDLDKVVTGSGLSEGDALIGLRSSGIHSNGLSLARRVLLEGAGLGLEAQPDGLERHLGEELLEPTAIYVKPILRMLREGLGIKFMANITGEGILNLCRAEAEFGFVIKELPEPQPIFRIIQELGSLRDGEMYKVFNMGIGFCVALPKGEVDRAISIAEGSGFEAFVMGKAVRDPERKVVLKPLRLMGKKGYRMLEGY